MERHMRLGRDEFDVDTGQQQEATERYDEGRGLIGGDPNKRPDHIRWRPIPEDQPYFRLIDISAQKRARLDGFRMKESKETRERQPAAPGRWRWRSGLATANFCWGDRRGWWTVASWALR